MRSRSHNYLLRIRAVHVRRRRRRGLLSSILITLFMLSCIWIGMYGWVNHG